MLSLLAWQLFAIVNYEKLWMRCYWCGTVHYSDHELIYSFLTALTKITDWLYLPNNGLCLTVMKSNFVACGMVNLDISEFVQAWSKHPDLQNIEYWSINGQVRLWPLFNFSTLIRSNKMQQYAGIYLLQNHSTCFGRPSHPSSGVYKTVTAASGTGHRIRATIFLQCGQFCHTGGRLLLRFYDLYQRLQLQFCVLLMIGAMGIRNM